MRVQYTVEISFLHADSFDITELYNSTHFPAYLTTEKG